MTEVPAARGVVTQVQPFEGETVSAVRGESFAAVSSRLPSSLVMTVDGQAAYVPVTWECVGCDFDTTDYWYYQFSPVWDQNVYPLAAGLDRYVDVPYASVYVGEAAAGDLNAFFGTAENREQIFTYLRGNLGLSVAATCGVMANIQMESNYNPDALGDYGTSYGLCQWHDDVALGYDRWTQLKNFCAANGLQWQNSVDGQMQFLQYELERGYKKVLSNLRSQPETAQGAYDAAYYYCVNYEVPANKEAVGKVRANLAMNTLWPMYQSRVGEDPTTAWRTKIYDGETISISLKGKIDLSEFELDFEPTTWTSSDPAIVKVNSDGVITGKTKGKAVITASNGKKKSEKFYIKVCQPTVSGSKIVYDNDSFYITLKEGGNLTVAEYESVDDSVLAVDSKTGEAVAGDMNGKTKLKVTFSDGGSVTATFKVKRPTIKNDDITVKKGATKQLTLKNATKESDYDLDVADSDIAKVSRKGVVKGLAKGETQVYLYLADGTLYDTCTVTVK